ncbi:MAG: hypothetical protein Q9221_009017, partial [Calogaya cf. arnoldii]
SGADENALTTYLNFVDVYNGAQVTSEGTSSSNEKEAEVISSMVKAILATGMPASKITICTGYRAQKSPLEAKAKAEGWSDVKVIMTIDSSQGGEFSVVILSLVTTRGEPGFMGSMERANVGTSRQMEQLYIVGKKDCWFAKVNSGFKYMHKIPTATTSPLASDAVVLEVGKFIENVLIASSAIQSSSRILHAAHSDTSILAANFIDPSYSSATNAFCSDLLQSKLSNQTTISHSQEFCHRNHNSTKAKPTRHDNPPSISTQQRLLLHPSVHPIHHQTAAPPTCTDDDPILQNGDFETRSLTPWTILSSTPNPLSSPNFTYNITSPGHKSAYAFTMTDNAAASYVEVAIGQTMSLCPNRTYRLSAEVYITDGGDTGAPRKEQYTELYVDEVLVASAPESFIQGPPRVGNLLEEGFTSSAQEGTAVVKLRFVATNLVAASWGVDDVFVVAT